jgi:hypothetical protein
MRASLLLILAGCGGAGSVAETIGTGDSLPPRTAEPAVCRADGGFRWLGSDPHVPFAVTGPDGVGSAGEDAECCAAWARAGDRWTAIDAWGAPVGEVTIAGGEGYDVTQCYELVVEPAPAAPGLLVRGDAPWTAPASARWEPSDAERAGALELAAMIDRVYAPQRDLIDDEDPIRPLAERIVFFTMPGDDGHDFITTRFAAIGGRAAAIIGIDQRGEWKLHHLDGTWSAGGLTSGETYRVLAVVDMDRDGFAEVVFHRNEGPAWDQIALRCSHDSTSRYWQESAISLGGSTA